MLHPKVQARPAVGLGPPATTVEAEPERWVESESAGGPWKAAQRDLKEQEKETSAGWSGELASQHPVSILQMR